MTWKNGTLSDLVFFQRGFDITKAQQRDGRVPVISSSGVQSYHSEAKVTGPGVIIGRKGTLGSVHYSDTDYWPHDTTLWSKDLRGNDPKFVYYFLKTLNLQKFDTGNSNPTLNRNHIHLINIRFPDIETQQRISSELAIYDSLIANNARRIELLERSARLLFEEWFVRFRYPGHEHNKIIDGVPDGWLRERIEDVADTIGGGTPSTAVPEYWSSADITWFVPTDITNNDCLVLLASERKISESGLRNSSAKIVPRGSILMTSRASVGFFGIYDEGDCCTNQGFIVITPKIPHARMFMLHDLMRRKEEIVSRAGGATYKEINKTTFRNMMILFPLENARRPFEEFCQDVFLQVRTLKRQSEYATLARDLLLPRLMDGRLEV